MLPVIHTFMQNLVCTEHIRDVRAQVTTARKRGEQVGCVPTMGALHAGHLSLIHTASKECDYLVVTVFVNPTQFGPHEDFDEYPRPFEADLKVCREAGVDLVFHPNRVIMYPTGEATVVDVDSLANILEGKFRPGHFQGVATIVAKFLNIVTPDVAYFGQKDFQQQLLIRQMCRDLHIPVDVRTCPTIREPDGLALSSRNQFLTPKQRQAALTLIKSLKIAETRLLAGDTDIGAIREEMFDYLNAAPGVQVDYATIANPGTLEEIAAPLTEMIALVAATVGSTRLIDNLPIRLLN